MLRRAGGLILVLVALAWFGATLPTSTPPSSVEAGTASTADVAGARPAAPEPALDASPVLASAPMAARPASPARTLVRLALLAAVLLTGLLLVTGQVPRWLVARRVPLVGGEHRLRTRHRVPPLHLV